MGFWIEDFFPQSVKEGHQDFAGFGAGLRLSAQADLASNHGGTQLPFGPVIVSWNLSVGDPVVEAMRVLGEDVLDTADAQVLSGLGGDGLNLLLKLAGVLVIGKVGERLRTQVHGGR